jgi:hypothetical protein
VGRNAFPRLQQEHARFPDGYRFAVRGLLQFG